MELALFAELLDQTDYIGGAAGHYAGRIGELPAASVGPHERAPQRR
jgi:hypothetical protein